MIQSKGNNQFMDNEFDFWTWSAPILQTQEEVVAAIHELKLIGRTIKDIQSVGYGYGWEYCDCIHVIFEAIHRGDDMALESMEFPCSIEIDDPLLIQFEDGDILGIDFSEGSSIRMEMNTLPWNIHSGITSRNFLANQLFRDILGRQIGDIYVSSSIIPPFFTGSHGMDLKEQSSYLHCFSFFCNGIGLDYETGSPLQLKFEPEFDYGCVSLERNSCLVSLPATRFKAVVDGYMSPEDVEKHLEVH